MEREHNEDSLIYRLNRLIAKRQYIWIDELALICREWRYKTSTAERRLRPSESPDIEPIMHHGAIIGYKRKGVVLPPVDYMNRTPRQNIWVDEEQPKMF